jgi:poly(3-hydroxybutyrate) depolymerase
MWDRVTERPTNSRVTRQDWSAVAAGSASVQHYTVLNGDHSVPSLESNDANSCNAPCSHDQDFAAIDAIWAYWNLDAGLEIP